MRKVVWPQRPKGHRPAWERYLDQLWVLAIMEKRMHVRTLYIEHYNRIRFSLHFWEKPMLS